jgi:iron complex outermembrane recepter protein
VFTYLANARYRFTDQSTAYVRYATGYRPGGPNIVTNDPITGLPAASPTFGPDELKSYEVGFKADSADRTYGMDMALYYTRWSSIQLSVTRNLIPFRTNAGDARIRGAELTLTARPIEALRLMGAFAYQDGELTQTIVGAPGAVDGTALPNVPRRTATLNADYTLPFGEWKPTVGGSWQYFAERNDSFAVAPYRLPSYTQLDLRAGMTFRAMDLQLYARNVTDRRGQLSGRFFAGVEQVAVQQPRTIGILALMKFQ